MTFQSDEEEVIDGEVAPERPPVQIRQTHPRVEEPHRTTADAAVAGERQRLAIRKLARLLGEEIELPEYLDSAQAADLIARLSRAFNALDPAERARRTRSNRQGS